jgi:hypothetical protein
MQAKMELVPYNNKNNNNTIVFLRMSRELLETCTGFK